MRPMLPVAILAGGLGTRLRPVTLTLPKALVEVNGEPFIVHQLRLLQANQIERAVVCLGYRGEMIREVIGNGSVPGLRVDFSFDGSPLRGTAGAIKDALPLLGDAFFVLYGDSYLLCDFYAVEAAFRESGRQGLMTVFRNEGQWERSNVDCVDGTIVAYEKANPTAGMRHVDYGLGVFKASAFGQIPDGVPCDLAAVYQDLLKRGQLAGFEVKNRFYEVGSFQGLEDLREFLRGRKEESSWQ